MTDLLNPRSLGTVAIIAPHPDDETLGCGGLIALLCEAGRRVSVIVVSDGSGSHPGSKQFPPDAMRRLRAAETLEAANILGLASANVSFMNLPDTAVPQAGADGFIPAVDAMQRLLTGFDTVVAPFRGDAHGDHRASFEIAHRAALRRRADPRLLEYVIWSGAAIPPLPTWRVEVTSVLQRKRAAIACYRSQLGLIVPDDPTGFQLAPEFVERFLTPFEFYLESDVVA
jgi:LmbE family N-acetylglucosaminyl deacetylase